MCIKTSKKKKRIKSVKSTWAYKKDSIYMRIKRLKRRSALRPVLFEIDACLKISKMKLNVFLC